METFGTPCSYALSISDLSLSALQAAQGNTSTFITLYLCDAHSFEVLLVWQTPAAALQPTEHSLPLIFAFL